MHTIKGNIVDIEKRTIFKGQILISTSGKIESIIQTDTEETQYILPGFIDAHIHIESSMVTPYQFAKMALSHGTVATISDPHEIANVCGIEGINYMIQNGKDALLKIFWGAPSCVPATSFENAGAQLTSKEVDHLLSSPDIWYLSEMMNYPGVLNNDAEVHKMLEHAKSHNKPIDGHAPGLRGDLAKKYISYGISTDHECFELAEALEKLSYGMKIIIREGSAARNFEALHPLIASNTDNIMFCSDDKHPNDLQKGHINLLVKRALELGYNLFDVLQIASINPINHYNIPVGKLHIGDKADFIIIDNLKEFNILETYIDGKLVSKDGKSNLSDKIQPIINNFNTSTIQSKDLYVTDTGQNIPVIIAIDRMLITEKQFTQLPVKGNLVQPDPENDIIKICIINRYHTSKPAIGFIKNFGLKRCAIASTVAHDSHNIIAVGDDDKLIADAVNLLVNSKGGLSAVSDVESKHISLPVAGLMSDQPVEIIGPAYEEISDFAKNHGSKLEAPFMTLSFMALLVIPKIKISDLGMFDAEAFKFYT